MDKKVINEIRQFNRFYAIVIGTLDSKISNTEYSITEARVLFEIQEKNGKLIANDLVSKLNIDRSYLSRILRKFTKNGLVKKKKSVNDNRKNTLTITKDGITALNQINASTDRQIVQLFSHLTNEEVLNVKSYMNKIQEYLEK